MQGRNVVERLRALSQRHAPGRVLAIVPERSTARWLQRLVVDGGPSVGLAIVDLDGAIDQAARELHGPPLEREALLLTVRRALVDDPTFEKVADQLAYLSEVLEDFVRLQRASFGFAPDGSFDLRGVAAEVGRPRDTALVAAFERFRELLPDEAWYAGNAVERVDAALQRAPSLARRTAAVAIGFDAKHDAWVRRMLERLEAEHWTLPRAEVPRPLAARLRCAGPEVEIAAVARKVRHAAAQGHASAVLVPAPEVARWARRLAHRDVPVRAYASKPTRETAAARGVEALLRVCAVDRVHRRDLDAVLFASAFDPWTAAREDGEGERPWSSSLRAAWATQRRSTDTLADYASGLRAAVAAEHAAIRDTAAHRGWEDARTEQWCERVRVAHELVASVLERLDAVDSVPAFSRVLADFALLQRARVHDRGGPETTCAQAVVDALKAAHEGDLERARAAVAVALDTGRSGAWVDEVAEGTPAVWVMPHSAALDVLPPCVVLAGLDQVPTSPAPRATLSDALCVRLKLRTPAEEFASQLAQLDRLAERGEVVASWRTRDGAGRECPAGPWIAVRSDGELEAVGLDEIAVGRAGPTCTLEAELLDPARVDGLARRIGAIATHESDEVGPHTGALGVRVPAPRPYSATALQAFAQIPYRYFVERVLGIDEPEGASETLDALEQGSLLHDALEQVLKARLEKGPVDVLADEAGIRAELLAAIEAGYAAAAEHRLEEGVWTGERSRWLRETQLWLDALEQRTRKAHEKAQTEGEEAFISARDPGTHVTGVERGFGEGFELELGQRAIPFAGSIDRLERDADGERSVIVDYKSGRPLGHFKLMRDIASGQHLQLPLYALAWNQLGAEGAPVRAMRLEYLKRGYKRDSWRPPSHEARDIDPARPVAWDTEGKPFTALDATRHFVAAFVDSIEAGRFPLVARVDLPFYLPGARLGELLRALPAADERAHALPPPLSIEPPAEGGEGP